MKELVEQCRRDDLLYRLLKRNEKISLYSVGGTYTDKVTHYEVCKIYIRKDKHGIRESLPTNEQFGRDLSRCFNDLESAEEYYRELSDRFNLPPEGHLLVSGVAENFGVIPEARVA